MLKLKKKMMNKCSFISLIYIYFKLKTNRIYFKLLTGITTKNYLKKIYNNIKLIINIFLTSKYKLITFWSSPETHQTSNKSEFKSSSFFIIIFLNLTKIKFCILSSLLPRHPRPLSYLYPKWHLSITFRDIFKLRF